VCATVDVPWPHVRASRRSVWTDLTSELLDFSAFVHIPDGARERGVLITSLSSSLLDT
jgi:hypothetical protein